MIKISFKLNFNLLYVLIIFLNYFFYNFLFMCAFVSCLLSNTIIMLYVYVVKAMTNNQPQVWIPGHKLLVFWRFTLPSSQLFTNCVFSLYYVNFVSLYLMFEYFHCLIMLIVTINYILTYLLTYNLYLAYFIILYQH